MKFDLVRAAVLLASLTAGACAGASGGDAGSVTPEGGSGGVSSGGAAPNGGVAAVAGSRAEGGAGGAASGGAAGSSSGMAGASGSAGGGSGSGSGGASGGGGGGGEGLSYFDFSAGDARGFSGSDFSPGHFKGECALGQVVTGVSVAGACAAPRLLQCQSGRERSTVTTSVTPYCGDARRDDSTGDWDRGYRKGECAVNEAVVGVSRDAEGGIHDLLCAERGAASLGAGTCTVRNVNGGDNRGRTSSGDWDAGYYKAECASGEHVKGVSLDAKSRRPHALLCCAGDGAVSVTAASNPEPANAGTVCNSPGQNASIGVFDKAHLTGSSRYLYRAVTFPEQGSYQRITMTLTLSCPANGCDPWDRWGNVGVVLEKKASDPGGDRMLELGRFVTPYGVGGTFTYDLTALRPALVGKKELRIFTDTWVDGWLATVKIEMQGGVPEKHPAFVVPLWSAPHVGVGVPSRPISASVPPRQLTLPQAACGLSVRAIITGHGQGNRDNCAEFCPKTHYFEVGAASHGRSVWRDDCATSAVQGQHGTWQYSRAGWCPGADVRALTFDIGADVSAAAKARKAPLSVAYDVDGYDNTCRPDNCDQASCVFDTACSYDGGAHTEPYYALTALLVGYR